MIAKTLSPHKKRSTISRATRTAIMPLVSSANLESYIRAIHQFPLLTQEEETALGARLQQQNDIEAARQLVLSHLRVVVSIARGYSGYGLQQADLIQEGNIGLMKAVKRFDPKHGVRLVSFAVHWIRAEIHEFILRNWRLVRIATTKSQRKLFFNLRSMKRSWNNLSISEAQTIADKLGVKQEEVLEMEVRMRGQDLALENTDRTDDDRSISPITYLADLQNEPTEQLKRRANDQLSGEGLLTALDILDARSRRIIESRWLAEEQGKTLQDLATEFSVSAERIRQIEQKALEKMRNHLSARR